MLHDNCWAIRLIAALLLTFMSHIRPVPSPQGGFGGLIPPKQCTKPPNWNMKTINYWSFVNFDNVKASTRKQKTHSYHNVGRFSPQIHTNHNAGWFSPELTLTITPDDFHPNSQSTITSGDFHLGTTWQPLLSGWKSLGVGVPGVWCE